MGMISHYLSRIYNLLTEVVFYHLCHTIFHTLYSKNTILTKGRALEHEEGTTLESVTGLILRYLLTLFFEPEVSISCHHKNKYSLKDQRPESNPFTSASLTQSIRMKIVSCNPSDTPVMERVFPLKALTTFYFELCIFIFSLSQVSDQIFEVKGTLFRFLIYFLKHLSKIVTCTNISELHFVASNGTLIWVVG